MSDTDGLTRLLKTSARRLDGEHTGLGDLIAGCANSAFVLIGEASHGTHEFYSMRAEITKRLIEEAGFQAVVIEADWPDANRVNQYVRAESNDGSPEEALSSFDKFPEWMWGNTAVRDFIGWLRAWNDSRNEPIQKVGFYGMDLYSLFRSRAEVLRYLESVDPEAARQARDRYSCFDHFGEDAQSYGYTVAFGGRPSCEDDAIRQLVEMQGRPVEDDGRSEDLKFYAEQNARLVKNAEEYFRTMFAGRVSSWNQRDRHMADTVDAVAHHLRKRVSRPKIILWAHNSHLGDARATAMGEQGEWNVGQLVRERYPGDTYLIGFTTHSGTVMAASDWGREPEVKRVRPGLPGSYEAAFHETGISRFVADLRRIEVRDRLLERAIGVIYRPETERYSHYFHADLGAQFDAVIHIDQTRTVQPLKIKAPVAADVQDAVPETFPTGV